MCVWEPYVCVGAPRPPSLVCGGLGVAAEAASARWARGGTLPGAGIVSLPAPLRVRAAL
jgi:hypothetical protein